MCVMRKSIVFDWFTIFKFHDDFTLGKPRKFAQYFIKRLILWGWRVYIFKPNIVYANPEILRRKIKQFGIPVFEILYGMHSLARLPLNRAVYVDMAYYYLTGGYWLALWFRRLRILRKVGNMRVFYDKDGKRISRSAVREKMLKESTGVGLKSDKKIKQRIIQGMSEEQYAKLRGMSYRDTEKSSKRR